MTRSAAIYMPILKGKMAEAMALGKVPSADRTAMLPFIEVIADDSDDALAVQSSIDALVGRTSSAWPAADLIVDSNLVAEAGLLPANRLPIEYLHDLARTAGLKVIPAVWLTSDMSVMSAAARITSQDGLGACIRLRLSDLDDVQTLGSNLVSIAGSLGLAPDAIDLLVDFAAIDETNVSALGAIATLVLPTLPNLHEWRSFTLASGAFPKNLDAYSAYVPGPAPRWDKQLWMRVSTAQSARTPAFGDYSVAHPDAATSGGFAPAPNLRYTNDAEWTILKGKKGTPAGNRDFMNVCAQFLAPNPNAFAGAKFSWGDTEIERCSRAVGGPGGAKEWRAWATNHHLAHVVSHLATTGAP